MDLKEKKVRALGLCSGGLDSILSALVLRQQGIDVYWITFETPFFSAAKAKKAAEENGIPIMVRNITGTYLEMLRNPPCGYGKHMNPCMDCHTLMFRLAGEVMKEEKFQFLFSGEVLGQRPMSQTLSSLRYVEKHSGFDGHILRPLSARHLPETLPEKEGFVDREKLLDFTGRSRKPQMKLAEELGVKSYPSPAGGCLLTDKGFSDRLRDLLDHQEAVEENELHLLKLGRHLRLNDATKAIVGRTKAENEKILQLHNPARDTVLKVKNHPGPTLLIPGGASKEMLFLAGAICAGYSKAPEESPVPVQISDSGGTRQISVLSVPPNKIKKFLI